MNVTIEHDSVDITTYIIEYTRNQQICTGIGTFDFLADRNISPGFMPWDTIILTEETTKKGTYLITDSTLAADGKYQVNCQDYSKKVQDYFIGDLYEVVDHPNCRYWINRFLNGAGVSVSFLTEDTGGPLNPYSSLGMATAYEIIMALLTQSGWYMYFDADGVAIIGAIPNTLASPNHTLEYTEITSINSSLDDNLLRNRAVVWGATRPDTGEWVFADNSVTTEWDYDSNDKRTVVLANSNIYDVATAEDLADKMLDEFSEIITIKYLTLVGEYDITLGDTIRINAGIGSTSAEQGLVTSVGSSLSSSGFTSNIIINERCPRLFGYFDEWEDIGYIPSTPSKVTYCNLSDPPYDARATIDFTDPTLSLYRYTAGIPFRPTFTGDLSSVIGRYGASPYDPAIYNMKDGYILPVTGTYRSSYYAINNAADTNYIPYWIYELAGTYWVGVLVTNYLLGTQTYLDFYQMTLAYEADMDKVYYYTYNGEISTGGAVTKYLEFYDYDIIYAKYGDNEYLITLLSAYDINPTLISSSIYSKEYTTDDLAYLMTDVYNITTNTHDLYLNEYTTGPDNEWIFDSGFQIGIYAGEAQYAVKDNFVLINFGFEGNHYSWTSTSPVAQVKHVTYLINLATLNRSWIEKIYDQDSGNYLFRVENISTLLYRKTGTSDLYAYFTLDSADEILQTHTSLAYVLPVNVDGVTIAGGDLGSGHLTEIPVQDQAEATFICNDHRLFLAEHIPLKINFIGPTETDYPSNLFVYDVDEFTPTHIGYLDIDLVGWDLPTPTLQGPNISNRLTYDDDSLFLWTGNVTKKLRQITFSGGSLSPNIVDPPLTFLANDFRRYFMNEPIAVFGNTIRGYNAVVYTSGWA